MRMTSVRQFRDHASEMFRSEEVILITRGGRPTGFFLPWRSPDLPDDVQREVFLLLSEQIADQREALGVTEDEVLSDFAAARRRR